MKLKMFGWQGGGSFLFFLSFLLKLILDGWLAGT